MHEIKSVLRKKMSIYLLLGCALVLALGGGVVYLHARKSSSDVQKTAQDEAQKLVAAVGKLMVLPSQEQPIIATVADPAKLSNQPFFAHALKGDKVLIYNIARKAILFRPETNLIIEVAPLSAPTPTPTPSPSPEE